MKKTTMKRYIGSLLLLGLVAATQALAEDAPAGSGVNRPVSSREIEQLNLQISSESRSSVEALGEYHTETGDINNRLDFWRAGGRLNYRASGATMLYLRGVETNYRTTNNILNERGLNFTGGVKHSISEGTSVQVELGGTRFSTSATTVNASGTLRHQTSGGSALYVTGSRTNVEESLLSAAGVRPGSGTFAGDPVGLVMDNRVVAGGRWQATRRLDFSAEGGGGVRNGRGIESNALKAASAGAGFNLLSTGDDRAVSLVRVAYGLDYFGFEKDLFGFGSASLPGARVSEPGGMGGYFSPAAYVSNVARFELQGRPHPHVEYHLAAFAGAQDYTGSKTRQASGFAGSVTFHLGERFSLPITYARDNFGPFTQQSVFFRLVARL
jgi:hypothetical protein